ncbi:galactose-binding domain-containing protein [Tieghemostelium lacteum]|uniref:Galactose-binding domain-containing protein n=1 Tax=Tieghemostelium lacteum TaxID=361077 RepID=A0A151ZEE1_TIELA|nr:galactose-binding domain-containing protein [Tieghemostelium lacteum]|eukprot:KYQ92326.1 galactose-binding domain-containing protein [Tieghemostelium lacteum]
MLLSSYTISAEEMSTKGLHIKDNHIYNSNGEMIMLRGVNRPGTEYSCVQYAKIFDGPFDEEHIHVIRDWKVNAVRVPLNEDCWLGRHAAESPFFGEAYREAIQKYIEIFTDNNMAVIIDLHWSSNGTLATQQIAMPSKEGAQEFWKQIASIYKSNSRVLFDLYNEPYPFKTLEWGQDEQAWKCWKDATGCSDDPEIPYDASGMQQLIDAVRSTGSDNIILLPGIQYASSVNMFLKYVPNDPAGQLGVSLHSYDFNHCNSEGCWDDFLRPVYSQYPIVATETGQKDCLYDYLTDFLHYADVNNIHYLAWSWLVTDCESPALIKDWDGTPTNYGQGYKRHLSILSKGKQPWYSDTFDMYNDKVTHWASDWSTAKRKWNDTDLVYQGKYSFSAEITPEGMFYLNCYNCIKTSVHKTLEFWINGGEIGDQDFSIQLINNERKASDTFTVQHVCSSSTIPASKWVKATIDLTQLPQNAIYSGFWLLPQNDQPKMYIDQVTVKAIYEPPNNDGDDDSSSSTITISLSTIILLLLLNLFL